MSVIDTEILPVEVEEITKTDYSVLEKILKRTIDIIGAIVGIIILFPATIVIKIANLIKGNKNSIFFSQERIGKDGKLFKLYKFQTMVPNADEYLKYNL